MVAINVLPLLLCKEFLLFLEEEDDDQKWKTVSFLDWAAVFQSGPPSFNIF
jgi:hypothetical protein